MSRHRAPRHRQAALRWATFGGAAVLALAGVQGTYAYWTDQATVPGDTLTSGSIELAAANATASIDLSFDTLVPGNSVATVVDVSNVGTAPLTWTASTSVTGNLDLAAAMTVKVTDDTAVTGVEPSALCAGAALADGGTSLGGSLLAAPRTLTAGASQQICVQVTLDADALSSLQGQTTGVSLEFTASQVIP